MGKKYRNTRTYSVFAILAIIAFLYGYHLFRPDMDKTVAVAEKPEAAEGNLIAYIEDGDDEGSVKFGRHLEKIADYTKFPFSKTSIKEWNAHPELAATVKVAAVQNTRTLATKTLDRLLKFVAEGGVLVLPTFNNDPRMAYFYGLRDDEPIQYNIKARGFKLKGNFLPNADSLSFSKDFVHDGIAAGSFSKDINVLITADNDPDFPVLVENKIGRGKVLFFNTIYELRKRDRGLIQSCLLKGLQGIPYPIVNVGTIFLDDFPSPTYDIKEEPIKSELDLTMTEFVADVWWPDMVSLADTFDIKYTALTVFDYRGEDEPQPIFNQWNASKIKRNGTEVIAADWIAKDVVAKGHELGLHGYNHISLLTSDWNKPDYMRIALNAARKQWKISGLGKLPVSYVPPSNYIDSIGLSQLGKGFPSLKNMCSLYLGDHDEGGDREFDPDPWNGRFFDYPRISSGFYFGHDQKYNLHSLFLYTGIWTHFVHPDDVYQIPENSDETAGNFTLRNSRGLGWRGWKNEKEGLLPVFREFLAEFKNTYPQVRFEDAKTGAHLTRIWRNASFTHQSGNMLYTVQNSEPRSEEEEHYWFMYVDAGRSMVMDAYLEKNTGKYGKTPYLDGYLYSIATPTGKITVPLDALTADLDIQIAIATEKATKDFERYKERFGKGEEVQVSEHQYEPSAMPGKNAPVGERVDYYVAHGKLKAATDLLKEKISNSQTIDTVLWNAYRKYLSWQEDDKTFWDTLLSYYRQTKNRDVPLYAREIGSKHGYPDETDRKIWLSEALKTAKNDPKILEDYYRTFNTPQYKDTIKEVLYRLKTLHPSAKNDKNYLVHLINYEPEAARKALNAYRADETTFLWDIATPITWLYANAKNYQKAYNWSKYAEDIAFPNKMFWLSELKDLETLKKEYKDHIAKNPNDTKVKAYMGELLLANNEFAEAWALANSLPASKEKGQLKRELNKGVLYVDRVTQKDLLANQEELFEEIIKESIQTDIRLTEHNSIAAMGEITGDNNSKTAFQRKITYNIKNKKLNTHSVSVTNSDIFRLKQVSEQDEDNIDKTLYGIEYQYSTEKPGSDLSYRIMGGAEKDENNEVYYKASVGASLSKNKNFTSATINHHPVKTGPGYEKKIYRSQLAVYNETNIANVFRSSIYGEGNRYTDDNLEGSVTARLALDNSKDRSFKIIPQVEASFAKSNSDEAKDYPYYIVDKRLYTGGGVGIKIGQEKSTFKLQVEGSTFIDNDLGNFNRLTGNTTVKIGKFTEIKASGELSTQKQAYSNSIRVGLKYMF